MTPENVQDRVWVAQGGIFARSKWQFFGFFFADFGVGICRAAQQNGQNEEASSQRKFKKKIEAGEAFLAENELFFCFASVASPKWWSRVGQSVRWSPHGERSGLIFCF